MKFIELMEIHYVTSVSRAQVHDEETEEFLVEFGS